MTDSSRWHQVVIDARVFPLEVVLKATYWMTGRFDVDLRLDAASDNVVVAIAGLDGPLEPHLSREMEIRLRRDLIDFRTRAVIEAETRTLREILVAKAFDDDGDA